MYLDMKKIKFIFYTFIILILLSLPIYSIGRIVLPKWVISQISARLPEGSTLTVGRMSSKSDLGILYESFQFESRNGIKLRISNFLVAPRLDFNKPLKFKADNAILEDQNIKINFSNINSVLSIDYDNIENSSLLGEMQNLQADELVAISNIDFLIKGLSSKKSKINLKADQFTAEVLIPKGRIVAYGKKAILSTELGNETITSLEMANLNLDLSKIQDFNENSKIFGQNVKLDFKILQKELWHMPISLEISNLKSPKGDISSKLDVKANGRWNLNSKSCGLEDLFLSNGKCGQLTDVLDVYINLSQDENMMTVLGNGFCVTPKAPCPQKISSKIKTKNTTDIFSKLMSSGLINPLFAGVVLGSLLSSPTTESSTYDHEVTFDVNGSRIAVNGKPLI